MPAVQQVAKVNREVQRLGLGKLSDPKLFDQMAFLVRDHAHFRGMLMHETQEVRNQMYQCLAPRLRFKALPLDVYEAQSKRIAEEKQLPQYNPSNLECREIRPYHLRSEEFRAQEQQRREAEAFVGSMRRDVVCELCEAGYAVTGDGRWHNYGTAEQCVCATSWLYPDGYPVAPSHPLTQYGPRTEGKRSVLSDAAEKAIARGMREAGANFQLELSCSVCTYEQKIRVKRKPSAYKIAKQDGWTFPENGKKSLCFACSKKRLN